MMIKGIFFIFWGFFMATNDIYDYKNTLLNKKIIKRTFEKDNYYEVKLIIGIFSFIVGLFTILSHVLVISS
ncbi:hypothetical protein [Clostridiisalibacter paucivorans]|uniref:hypothetical protein n=1 Tax=Clostridiisalibacter paucivorans TaxID=408753 RepID=UPI00047DD726|nr:hypothetical protein [Clostridiisalibacter paucivorans]